MINESFERWRNLLDCEVFVMDAHLHGTGRRTSIDKKDVAASILSDWQCGAPENRLPHLHCAPQSVLIAFVRGQMKKRIDGPVLFTGIAKWLNGI